MKLIHTLNELNTELYLETYNYSALLFSVWKQFTQELFKGTLLIVLGKTIDLKNKAKQKKLWNAH